MIFSYHFLPISMLEEPVFYIIFTINKQKDDRSHPMFLNTAVGPPAIKNSRPHISYHQLSRDSFSLAVFVRNSIV